MLDLPRGESSNFMSFHPPDCFKYHLYVDNSPIYISILDFSLEFQNLYIAANSDSSFESLIDIPTYPKSIFLLDKIPPTMFFYILPNLSKGEFTFSDTQARPLFHHWLLCFFHTLLSTFHQILLAKSSICNQNLPLTTTFPAAIRSQPPSSLIRILFITF